MLCRTKISDSVRGGFFMVLHLDLSNPYLKFYIFPLKLRIFNRYNIL
jgi:hypothetical protein